MNTNITVGIIGCSVVGGVLKKWLEEHNQSVRILISDPYKGYYDDVSGADIIFISIHIPTEIDGSQDLTALISIIEAIPQKTPIFIRTTIIPGTANRLSTRTGRKVYFMPEFLTERTAYSDFCRQPMIFTAEIELLKKIFVGKPYMFMTSTEAELAKYVHNVFGALKVTYFNGVYDMCKKMGVDYCKVQQGALLSGYISPIYTQVPGPDGQPGYGGKCFPKDVNAFAKTTQGLPIHLLLKELQPLNNIFRKIKHDSDSANYD